MSAPSSGALAITGRACGAATMSPVCVGRVGPARSALTGGHGDVEEPAAACAERVDAGARRRQTGERVGDGVTAEKRTIVCPRDETAGGGSVVAERDAVGALAVAAVAGDRDPDLRAVVGGDDVAGVQAELCQGAGAAGLDHDVGCVHECSEDPDALTALQVEGDGSLLPVEKVEELAGAAACSVGSLRRLDLHHGGTGAGEEIAAQRARPEGRQVDHDKPCHVGS